MKVLGWLLVAVLSAGAALTLDPASFGWSERNIVAQAIGMRTWLAVGFAGLAVLALLAAGVWRWVVEERPRRLLTLALVFAVVGGAHAGVLAMRGLGAGTIPTAASEAEGELTVISLNPLGAGATTERVVSLVLESGADVVFLPESGRDVALGYARALADEGAQFQVFPGAEAISADRGTSVLVAASMGAYREVPSTAQGTVRLEPADGVGPVLAAVHPVSIPFVTNWSTRQEQLDRWREELQAAVDLRLELPGGIIGGDFNATLDHAPLRDLGEWVEASSAAGIGGYGTFPLQTPHLPGLLGAPIDHVLVDGGAWEVTGGAVVDVPGSDHRAVVFRLAPAG